MFAFTQLIFDYADMIVKDNCIQANAELLENSEKFLQILFLRWNEQGNFTLKRTIFNGTAPAFLYKVIHLFVSV